MNSASAAEGWPSRAKPDHALSPSAAHHRTLPNLDPAARFTPQQEASALRWDWSKDLSHYSRQQYCPRKSGGPFRESTVFRSDFKRFFERVWHQPDREVCVMDSASAAEGWPARGQAGHALSPFCSSPPDTSNLDLAASFTPQQEASSLPSSWSKDLSPRSSRKYYPADRFAHFGKAPLFARRSACTTQLLRRPLGA